ncbi:MAG: trigger factor [Candidatus Dormibacteraceae bacterium]
MSEVQTTPGNGVKVEKETLPGSRVQVVIEVPAEQVDAAFERTLRRLGQRVRVQGFRPGKAPRALLEAKIGPQGLREEVADLLIPDVVGSALTENEIEPIDRPQVDIEKLERGEPGRFRARVSVMPEVTLPDVSALHVEPARSEITEVDVERQIERRLDDRTEVQPVEREVRVGDQVVGDLSAFVDGKEIPSEARTAIELDVREGVLVPELYQVLPGASVGDEVTAELTMPETHSNPELRGRLTTLRVKVQGVKQKDVPELTDELATEISEGAQTTAGEFRDEIRRQLVETAERSDRVSTEQRAVEAYVEAAQLEVPDALVDHEVDHQIGHLEEQLQQTGLKLDRYFDYQGRTEQSYRAELRPQAEGRIRTDLVLTEAAKELVVEPTEAEVKAYIREEAETEPSIAEDLEKFLSERNSLDFFRQRLTRVRIVERVAELVTGEHPVSGEAGAHDDDVERIEVQIPDEASSEQESGETGGAADVE